MNENQNISGENLPGKEPERNPQGEPPPMTVNIPETKVNKPSTTQPQQAMEVHHHGHVHEKKKWKEYLFQFLMLFLAVFFGFLAENLREHIEDNKKEKEYIKSLIVDLGIDRAMISNTREKIAEQIRGFDTLQALFSSDLKNDAQAVFDCYYYSSYLQLSFPVNFNERTITQLLSSGSMRLIKTSGVADRVTEYFNIVKDVDVQKQLYIDNINKCIESMYTIYDIANLRRRVNERDSLIFIRDDWSAIQLLSTEPADLKKFIATMEITKLIIHGYKLYLGIIDDQAEGLKEFLEKEYHLKSK